MHYLELKSPAVINQYRESERVITFFLRTNMSHENLSYLARLG
jgi:hypothetical protein